MRTNIEQYRSDIPRLDPEFKKEWVTALRSGNYLQGFNALKRRESHKKARHCCLGVACEVLNRPVRALKVPHRDEIAYKFDRTYESMPKPGIFPGWGFLNGGEIVFRTITPDDWDAYLNGAAGFYYYEESFTLPNLNDKGFTFEQIADIIDYFL